MDARLTALLLGLALPASAQLSVEPPPSRPDTLGADTLGAAPAPASQGAATTATGGVVRVLDKIDGTVTDLDLATGETGSVGSLTVTLGECRFPSGNPAGDAFALVSIRDAAEVALFEGWLVASAPALNAMDHPRYDAWALRCRGA